MYCGLQGSRVIASGRQYNNIAPSHKTVMTNLQNSHCCRKTIHLRHPVTSDHYSLVLASPFTPSSSVFKEGPKSSSSCWEEPYFKICFRSLPLCERFKSSYFSVYLFPLRSSRMFSSIFSPRTVRVCPPVWCVLCFCPFSLSLFHRHKLKLEETTF